MNEYRDLVAQGAKNNAVHTRLNLPTASHRWRRGSWGPPPCELLAVNGFWESERVTVFRSVSTGKSTRNQGFYLWLISVFLESKKIEQSNLFLEG